jgi:spore coat polysaccharide biosynthesis predicted glycosyltransferase SpsG
MYSKKKKILFLTDKGNKTIGFGHYSRCKAALSQFQSEGHEVCMFLYDEERLTSDDVIDCQTNIISANWQSISFIDRLNNPFDIVFVDSYLCELDIYILLSKRISKLIVFDDYNRLDYPSNAFIIRAGILQQPLLENNILTGIHYYPIQREFFNEGHNLMRDSINLSQERVCSINLGGLNRNEYMNQIIDSIIATGLISEINIIGIKSKFESNKMSEKIVVINHGVLDSEAISNLYKKSNLVIVSSGVSVLECIVSGTVFIPLRFNSNQIRNMNDLVSLNLAEDLFIKEDIKEKLSKKIITLLKWSELVEFKHKLKKISKGITWNSFSNNILMRLYEEG